MNKVVALRTSTEEWPKSAVEAVQRLRARVEELEEEMRQREADAFDPSLSYTVTVEWGLTRREAQVLWAIASRPMTRSSQISGYLYGCDPPNYDGSKVFICKARKKLRRVGLEILSTGWGVAGGGQYWLEPDARARVLAAFNGEAAIQ